MGNESIPGVKAFGIDLAISAKEPDFNIYDYDELIVKCIMRDDRPSGVCHLKTRSNIKPSYLLGVIQEKMPGYSADLAFPGAELEYPVFVSASDPVDAECILTELKSVDDKLVEVLQKK